MKRILSAALAIAVLLFAFSAFAVAAEKAAGKPQSVTGEVVDLGCYMGHGAKGAAHAECAMKCVANGMPMGLLTDKGTLYVLTMNHENADPFNATKALAGQKAKITGAVSVKNGIKTLEVETAEALAKAADKAGPAKY
jgi:hypothetical protein